MRPDPCVGKATFPSVHQAQRSLRKDRSTRGVRPYRCKACAAWHLGRAPRPRPSR